MASLRYVFLLSLLFILQIGFGQGCIKLNLFSRDRNIASSESGGSGNGGSYEGKLIVLFHNEDGFTCEGKPHPKQILVRDAALNWTLSSSVRARCDVIKESVLNVVYDEAANVATLNTVVFYPPTEYKVNTSLTANTPDINLTDGICEDSNGGCSLQAAIDQVMAISLKNILISVSAGTYKLTSPLVAYRDDGAGNAYVLNLTIRGEAAESTVIDGQTLTSHLLMGLGSGSTLKIENLKFLNGTHYSGTVSQAGKNIVFQNDSSVFIFSFIFRATMYISNCIFSGNGTEPTLQISPMWGHGPLYINNSKFDNNSIAIRIYSAPEAVVIENSAFTANRYAVILEEAGSPYPVTIRNTSFIANTTSGIYAYNCFSCKLENLTLYQNTSAGVSVTNNAPGSSSTLDLINSTLIDNGDGLVGGANFSYYAATTLGKVNLYNTVLIKTAAGTGDNCRLTGLASPTHITFSSAYNLISDTSCGTLSSSNNYLFWDKTTQPDLFLPQSDFYGKTIFIPVSTSPLVDAGSDLYCSTKDQREYPRPVDKLAKPMKCEIGAIELQ